MYSDKIKGEIKVFDYSVVENAGICGRPSEYRNNSWMVLGPFVMPTDGAFETEYLYKRDIILEPDYLIDDGGEKNIAPYIGLKCHNRYLGGDNPVWKEGLNKWDSLRFDPDDGDSSCDEALFMTEQRNCIFYAAVYVRCEGEKRAVISYENSGCRLYLNGELVSDTPFGRVKGVNNMGALVPVTFKDGLNLILFKMRPGYICDTVDLCMSNFAIWPAASEVSDVILTHPAATSVFTKKDEMQYQIFPCFLASFKDSEDICVIPENEKPIFNGSLSCGQVKLLRLEIPASEGLFDKSLELSANGLSEKCKITVNTTKSPDFKGTEYTECSFHFDTTYHQEQRVYAMGAIYILREILKEMRKDPSFSAVISELDYLHPYYSIYPDDRDFLKNQFVIGKAESDCFYNQPNELTSSGEGIVRNMLYGQLYHRDVLGRICHVYSPGDVFGHFNQMSQICAKGGCTGIHWSKHVLGFSPVMRHVSPDGTSLIHIRGGIDRTYAAQKNLSVCHAGGSTIHCVPGYPVDGDTSWMKDTIPNGKFGVPSQIHNGIISDEKNALDKKEKKPFALTSRDMALYHSGTTLTRTDFKQANRLGENLLITAEKFATAASLLGAQYPEKALDKAWRQILCGQHHDSITGTNNEISFVDLLIEYREAVDLARDIITKSTQYISSLATSDYGKPITVFNPHAWDRTEYINARIELPESVSGYVLRDFEGNETDFRIISEEKTEDGYISSISFKATVPSLGYAVYGIEKGTSKIAAAPIFSNDSTIENEYFRLTIDPEKGGGIISIFDKKEQREIVKNGPEGPANRLIALKETHNRMEAQHEFYTTGHRLESTWSVADVISEKTSDYEKLTIKYDLGNVVHVTQEIELKSGRDRIDFKTRCDDYREEDDLFCVTFPTNLNGVKAIFDDRFAPQVRNESLRSMEFRCHQYASFSHSGVYPANQWMDYGPSVTIVFDKDNSINLGMTQIIAKEDSVSENTIDNLLLSLTEKAIPVTVFPDTDQPMIGSQIKNFNEDLYSDTRIVLSVSGDNNKYADKLLNTIDERSKNSIFSNLSSRGYATVYLKDSDNIWKKPIDVILVISENNEKMSEVSEIISKELSKGRFINLDAIMVSVPGKSDDYGVGLINTGNIACSVEKGGMLNLMLFHTAEFYGNIGNVNCGSKLIPENKSHIFTYSILPHKESYREAQIYKKSFEKNDPLFACLSKEKSKPVLPSKYSFLKAEGNGIVTAFKATGAPMASMKSDYQNISERGLSVRFFEPDGISGKTIIRTGFDINNAFNVNLLEEGNEKVAFDKRIVEVNLNHHEISTVKLIPSLISDEFTSVIGAQHEITQPTYIRSWEHDLGSMPMGFMAVSAVISRNPKQPDSTHIETEISVANNYTDKSISGKAVLELPEGWKSSKQCFEYNIPEGGHTKFPVTFIKPDPNAKGIIKLHYSDNEQDFYDIFEVGYFDPDFTMNLKDNKLIATIENNTSEAISGELWIATPIETWGQMDDLNPFGVTEIGPACIPINLKSGEKKEIIYNVTGDENLSFYAVGKLCCNGRIHFSGVEKKGPRHCVWAHLLIDDLFKDNSLNKLLEQ